MAYLPSTLKRFAFRCCTAEFGLVLFNRKVSMHCEELYVPPVTTMTLPLRSGISVSGLKVFGIF
jgi:hypothetical protein